MSVYDVRARVLVLHRYEFSKIKPIKISIAADSRYRLLYFVEQKKNKKKTRQTFNF